MKKLTLLLAMCSILAFAACNGDGDKDENAEDTTSMEQQEMTQEEMAPPQEPYELVSDSGTTPNDYCIYKIASQAKLVAGGSYEHAVGDKICIRCDDKLSGNRCEKISMTDINQLLFQVPSGNQYTLTTSDDLFCMSCPPTPTRYRHK